MTDCRCMRNRCGCRTGPHRWVAIMALAWMLGGITFAGAAEGRPVPLGAPLGTQGTVGFTVQTDREYHTGPNVRALTVPILEIPGIAAVRFSRRPTVCELEWRWARGIRTDDLTVQLPRLPGPETFFVQYAWDAAAGRLTGHVNGMPLRLAQRETPPWELPEAAQVLVAGGPFTTELVAAEPRCLDAEALRERVPEKLLRRHADLFGGPPDAASRLGAPARRGALLYEAPFTGPDSTVGWVMEGPGKTTFADGWMTMASTKPNSPFKRGHIVHWCPEVFPASFIAEWEVEVLSEHGLCIVFFAARGADGEDLFDPGLPERTGVFKQYTRGAIDCYHISYYANTPNNQGRITSNMRKNSGFYLVANGPPGIPPESSAAHTVRLVKAGAHMQLQVDGDVVIDFTDDGDRYGAPHGAGRIGFRQMQWTAARYRNLRVYAFERKPD